MNDEINKLVLTWKPFHSLFINKALCPSWAL